MGATLLPRGIDTWGIVHIDSNAKRTYIWPVCGSEHLDVYRVPDTRPITCIECLAKAVTYGYEGA
jgi:hypothetical protein